MKDHIVFSKSSYITVEDPFKYKVEKILRGEVHDGHKKIHDVAFKPAKTVADRPYRAPFEHMTDRVEIKKKIKDEDGHVITGPRNFYTNATKTGISGSKM